MKNQSYNPAGDNARFSIVVINTLGTYLKKTLRNHLKTGFPPPESPSKAAGNAFF
jgi:hypothetical protein